VTEDVLQTLADLVSINSVNPSYAGGVPEAELADYVERFFIQRGIQTIRQEVDAGRPNVIARIPGHHSQRRIVFEAHMDTVSVVGMTIDPWKPEIRGGRLYGRGSCDTKGGMAAMMQAAASLVADGITPPCDVIFAATMDEEFSFRGVSAMCSAPEVWASQAWTSEVAPGQSDSDPRNGSLAEVAIVAEPTMLQPAIASKGLVRWKIETRGRAAHSSKPHLGVNAINHMAHLITAIEQDSARLAENVHPLLGPATCSIGVIRGGVQINFVPDSCEIEIDRRVLPGEAIDSVLAHYQQLIDSVAGQVVDMDAVMQPPMLTDVPLETDGDCRAVQVMAQILNKEGLDPKPIGVPFGSDASKFGALGIPSMILGPGCIDQAHAAVEYIDCEQVVRATKVYRSFMTEFQ
jgi:acetylornithine deacetylase